MTPAQFNYFCAIYFRYEIYSLKYQYSINIV